MILSLVLGAACAVSAQPADFRCAHTGDPASASAGVPASGPAIPVTGAFRTLVVFVRFADEAGLVHGGCGPDDWPVDAAMPVIGSRLLQPLPGSPQDPESLTAFFHEMSRGRWTLYGDEFGYTTRGDAAEYRTTWGDLNLGKISRELLEDANTARLPGVVLSRYATNGQLNHVFIVLRSLPENTTFAGSASNSGISELGLGLVNGALPTFQNGAVRVDPSFSGSINRFQTIEPMRDNVFVLAHEIGHDIWRPQVHLGAVTGNGVPARPPQNSTAASGDAFVGYGLMVSNVGRVGDVGVASAAERAEVSRYIADPAQRWIECSPLTDGTAYTVRDAVTTGDCFRLSVPAESGSERAVTFSNMQRASVFNAPSAPETLVSGACPECVAIERGLLTTGLLVEVTRRLSFGTLTRDVVPADNQLSGFQGCDLLVGVGPTAEQVHGGDFWRPGLDRQLTPWTRPNVYGYNTLALIPAAQRAAVLASGLHAVDDIRQGAGTAIDFTYHRFYPMQPVAYVRKDWWITPETNGLATFNVLRVQAGATLTVEPGAIVTVTGGLVVDEGGVLDARGEVRFGPGATLVVNGGMTATGAFLVPSNPALGWGGVRLSRVASPSAPAPTVTWTNVTVDGVVLPALNPTDKFYVPAAVTVYDRDLAISGGRIEDTQNGGGIYVAGAQGGLVLDSSAIVRDNPDGAGVRLASGASGTVSTGAVVERNATGVVAEGPGAYVLLAGSTVQNNTGFGVQASLGGRVAFNSAPGAFVTVADNLGGLSAVNGSDLTAGLCGRFGCGHTANRIERNGFESTTPGYNDAEAFKGSVLYAEGNRWGSAQSVADLTLEIDDSSYLSAAGLVPPGGAPRLAAGGSGGGEAARGVSAAPLFALASARLAEGDTLGAAEAITGAIDAAADDDDRRAAFEAAARLAALAQPGVLIARLTTETTAAPTATARGWARRALLAAAEATADPVKARQAAEALVADHAGTDHEAAGHAALVRLAVAASDEAAAEASLGALLAGFADDPAAEPSATLIAAAFAPSEGAARSASPAATAAAKTTSAAAAFEVGPVVPNPAAGRIALSVQGAPESVDVEVFDGLGRLVVPRARHAADARLELDVSRLAPGPYVVRVTGEGTAQARRFVVVR